MSTARLNSILKTLAPETPADFKPSSSLLLLLLLALTKAAEAQIPSSDGTTTLTDDLIRSAVAAGLLFSPLAFLLVVWLCARHYNANPSDIEAQAPTETTRLTNSNATFYHAPKYETPGPVPSSSPPTPH
jgi:hypothetical protein